MYLSWLSASRNLTAASLLNWNGRRHPAPFRVLDALVLLKDAKGKPWRLDLKDLPPEQREAVGFIDSETHGLFDDDDAATFYEGMVPGSAIVALAIEHTWAIKLVNALQNAGVEVALNYRVPVPIVDEAFASLVTDE